MSTRFFPTAFGVASVSWNEHGLTRFHLPEESAEASAARPLPRSAARYRGHHAIARRTTSRASRTISPASRSTGTLVSPFQKKGLPRGAGDQGRANDDVRGNLAAARLGARRRARRRHGARRESVATDRAVPSGRRGRWKTDRLFGAGRHPDQDAAAGAGRRRADAE